MTVLLQVSDTHFGTERPAVMQALLQLARTHTPELVVLSGDITQRARRSQFRAARAFVDQLDAPALLTIPGNHDIPLFNLLARAFAPYGNYVREFGSNLEPTYESSDMLVIGVNTTRARRHKHGEVSQQQVDRVAAQLSQAAATQLRIVVTHHPVVAIRTSDEVNLLRGRTPALAAWSDAGMDLIIGGHVHLPYARALRSRYPQLSRDIWTVQAGTAVSSRIREGVENSVNIIRSVARAESRRCTIERWLYSPTTRCFGVAATDTLSFA